jgi:hypothetical protein
MQSILPLFNFDASDLLQYYEGWIPGCNTVNNLQWSSLGPIGSSQLSLSDYLDACDLDRPQHSCSDSFCEQCIISLSLVPSGCFLLALWDMTQNLVASGCVFSEDSFITGYYFIQPKPHF